MATFFMATQELPIQAFLDYVRFEKRYSQHTITSYQNDLEQFFSFLKNFDSPPVTAITAAYVRSWLAGLKGEEHLTAKTINRKISTLKSFFKYQQKLGVISVNPMTTVSAPKISRKLPQFVKEDDMQTLFNYVEFPDDWAGRTNRLILLMLYSTGMRLSELIGLRETQLDEYNQQVKVLGKGNKERVIPVSSELMQEVKAYVAAKPAGSGTQVFVTASGKPLYPKLV
ncbi:MAG TPA: site-specific integrase, partial [Chitinophagaceae bacterium]